MDRIDFSKSIDVDPATQVKHFFTEVMAMYNLCEGINYNLLRGFVNGENLMEFLVKFNTLDETMAVASNLLNADVSLYGKVFHIEGGVSGIELSLIFREK